MSDQTSPETHEDQDPNSVYEDLAYVLTFAFVATFVLLIQLAAFAILLWALIHFAQTSNSSTPEACASRETKSGFTGNPDFYGFGIRLGIYLQWWASLIANIYLRDDWASMLAAYMVFSTALIVAVILITFQHACTFTAEVIVILFIYWGGYTGLLYTTDAVIQTLEDRSAGSTNYFGVGLSYALMSPTWFGIAFSLWFWLRLGTVGEVDFARTPGGTRYFLFAPISTDTKAAARFIVVLCFYFAGTLIYSYIGYISRILWGAARNLYSLWIGRHREAQTTSSQEPPAAPPRPTKSWMQRVERSERLVSALSYYVANFWNVEKRVFGTLGVAILVYSTIGVELTLYWNSISDIYSASSTGQIIPLAAGLGLLINSVWKSKLWKKIWVSDFSRVSIWLVLIRWP